MQYIVDITRTHAGYEDAVVRNFLESIDRKSSDHIEILLTDRQYVIASLDESNLALTTFPATAGEAKIAATVTDRVVSSLVDGEYVTVASFRPLIKQQVESLSLNQSHRVKFIPLAEFAPTATTASTKSWPHDFMPREEAISHLLATLAHFGGPVRKTDIRGYLQTRDPKFRKQIGTFAAQPKFISHLVSLAQEEDLLVQEPFGDPNPYISLTPVGRQRARVEFGDLSKREDRKPNPVQRESRTSGSTRRSDDFINVLKSAGLGPFQQVRLTIYEEIERLVKEQQPTPPKLIRDAVHAARESWTQSQEEKPLPWAKIREFFISLVNRHQVLLSSGKPVSHSWSEAESRVDSLADEWKTRLDGELICFLLASKVKLSLADIADISGALYNSRRDEYFDRVLYVVQWLLREGRVEESSDGVLSLSLPKEEGVTAAGNSGQGSTG
ncbi:hypothetical protein ACH47C_11165 [Streptomyces rishiriensis]|uniref:hypothetical protein n=1 Tax=Streptomyces rishiriensis TaxID=68264 RepID=UPI00340B4126